MRWLVLVLPLGTAVACNEILNTPDRELTPTKKDRSNEVADVRDPPIQIPPDAEALDPPERDAGPDGPLSFTISPEWKTVNDAGFQVDDAGTTITAFDPTKSHPVIVPITQPPIPSDDYTVIGKIFAPNDGEFGVIARVQADGSAISLSNKFGPTFQPWLGTMQAANDWNPSIDATGAVFTFTLGVRYWFRLRVVGEFVAGKIWPDGSAEPAVQVTAPAMFKTGRGAGFYSYGVSGAVLESLEVTVP